MEICFGIWSVKKIGETIDNENTKKLYKHEKHRINDLGTPKFLLCLHVLQLQKQNYFEKQESSSSTL